MRTIAKLAIGAAMACGAAVAATAPAGAQVLIDSTRSTAMSAVCYDAAGNFIWSSPVCTAYSYSYWYSTPVVVQSLR